jgi:transcriptional regulator with XRE-family HTH domain
MSAITQFGAAVQARHSEMGLSQAQLVECLKQFGVAIGVTYLSKIENGKLTHPPSEQVIRAIAQTLKTDTDVWLDMSGKIDTQALQQIANEVSEPEVLLWRMVQGHISAEQIRKWLEDVC